MEHRRAPRGVQGIPAFLAKKLRLLILTHYPCAKPPGNFAGNALLSGAGERTPETKKARFLAVARLLYPEPDQIT